MNGLQACGMYLPWNLETRTFEMQSHAMSIRSTSSPFAFGCQFGDLSQFRKKRPALELEEVGTGLEVLKTANSSSVEIAAPMEMKVSLEHLARRFCLSSNRHVTDRLVCEAFGTLCRQCHALRKPSKPLEVLCFNGLCVLRDLVRADGIIA